MGSEDSLIHQSKKWTKGKNLKKNYFINEELSLSWFLLMLLGAISYLNKLKDKYPCSSLRLVSLIKRND